MRRRLTVGAALSAGVGVLASLSMASASTLEVDGGVIQHWHLPVAAALTTAEARPAPAPAQVATTQPAPPAPEVVAPAVAPVVDPLLPSDEESVPAPVGEASPPPAAAEPTADDASVTESP